jgi:hypothetical protein
MKTKHTQKRQTSISPAGFELAIPASERPQIGALDCAATRIGLGKDSLNNMIMWEDKPRSIIEINIEYKTIYPHIIK